MEGGINKVLQNHCVKSAQIRTRKNSVSGHFSHSEYLKKAYILISAFNPNVGKSPERLQLRTLFRQ